MKQILFKSNVLHTNKIPDNKGLASKLCLLVPVPAGQVQRRVAVHCSAVGRVRAYQFRVRLQQQPDRLGPEKNGLNSCFNNISN